MPNNLPARLPVRAENEATPVSASSTRAIVPAEVSAPVPSATAPAAASPALVLDRKALTLALRLASRLASRAPIQALKSCLFADGYLVATDLDVSLRARLPSTGYLGVLVVAADALKRCVFSSEQPDVGSGTSLRPRHGRSPLASTEQFSPVTTPASFPIRRTCSRTESPGLRRSFRVLSRSSWRLPSRRAGSR